MGDNALNNQQNEQACGKTSERGWRCSRFAWCCQEKGDININIVGVFSDSSKHIMSLKKGAGSTTSAAGHFHGFVIENVLAKLNISDGKKDRIALHQIVKWMLNHLHGGV